MSDEEDLAGPRAELYVASAWAHDHIRKALSDALGVSVHHFCVGFSYNSSGGPGIGAISSTADALHELNPASISEFVTQARIKNGETLLHPPPKLSLVKP